MPCELCGRECKGGREAIIDGAKMFCCPDCLKYAEGTVQQEPPRTTPSPHPQQRPLVRRTQKPERDIYQDKRMEKELGISLLEDVKPVPTASQTHAQGGYTLGDFIKPDK